MQLKNSLLILSLIVSFQAFGLTEIPSGKVELEGKIRVENGKTYILMNPGTLSQTKVHLIGDCSIFKDQTDSNARIIIKLDKKLMSSNGEAQLIKLVKFLHPAEDLKSYNEEKDFQ